MIIQTITSNEIDSERHASGIHIINEFERTINLPHKMDNFCPKVPRWKIILFQVLHAYLKPTEWHLHSLCHQCSHNPKYLQLHLCFHQ